VSDDTPSALVAAVRDGGIRVRTEAVATFVEALAQLDLERPASLYWAGRLTLVQRAADLPAYDAAFLGFVAGSGASDADDEPDGDESAAAPPARREAAAVTTGGPETTVGDDADDGSLDPDQLVVHTVASVAERLAHRDFATCTESELAELNRAIDRLRGSPSLRRSRRRRRSGTTGDRLDLRRTSAAALRTDGELLVRHHRARTTSPRRLVLLVDVSGSMAPYARMLLRFGHAAAVGGHRTEVFTVGTRLTRVTRELGVPDPDRALAAVSGAVTDWSGGTRLAEGIGRFVDDWGRRGTARGAVVVVLSDGWERGDPAELGERMRQLHLLAHRIVWVNPLRAAPGYRPLAGGMAAALPHVDHFVDGHSLRSLGALAELLAGVVD
jgi:uncharacterized protein with von Willebrand factor type A (vWA) domain